MCFKHVTHNLLGLDHDVVEYFRLPSDSQGIPTVFFEKHGFLGSFFMLIGSSIDVCVSGRKAILHVSEAAIPTSLFSSSKPSGQGSKGHSEGLRSEAREIIWVA